MAGATLRAIVPKRLITTEGIQQRVHQWLVKIAEEFKLEMQVYPPKVISNKRTYKYRRGWQQAQPHVTLSSVIIFNRVQYARFVGGPKYRGQKAIMRRYGWRSTTDVVPAVISRNRQELNDIILPYRDVRVLPKGRYPRRR